MVDYYLFLILIILSIFILFIISYIMSLNYTIVANPQSLTQDELLDEFEGLSRTYRSLKETHENDLQKIYELKRNNQTLLATESYLSNELETINSATQKEIESINQKHQIALDSLKNEIAKLKENQELLESECIELKQDLEEAKKLDEDKEKSMEIVSNNNNSVKEHILEKEILALTNLMEEMQKKFHIISAENTEYAKVIEILRDKVVCVEDTLSGKKAELFETQQILESTQESMMELNSELAIFKNVPEPENKKGNSLFAEVDDQRQKMQRVLAAQKKHYLQMKQAYNESEFEIRRLKRENISMRQEIKACSELFNNADITYREKLNNQIMQLTYEKNKTQKNLDWTEHQLIDISNEKGVNWVDSILSFCKNETKELKEQLYNIRVQKSFSDEELHNKQQELAKWRFEAIKARMIIAKLKNLLDEHNVKVEPYEQHITKNFPLNDELESATPNTNYIVEPDELDATLPFFEVVVKQEIMDTTSATMTDSTISLDDSIKKEKIDVSMQQDETIEPLENLEYKIQIADSKCELQDVETIQTHKGEVLAEESKKDIGKSILSKNRDFLNFLNDKKSVSFPVKEENLVQTCEIPAENKENANFKIKSKVLVKRIVIPSFSQPKKS